MAARGGIKTPTNQKLLTNVAVVRIKKNGKRFEIACYKNKVLSWRQKSEKDINEVLQTDTVFVNVSKGQVAKREELAAAFDTEDQMEVCKMILDKGELQVSEKERSTMQDSTFKEVATTIADMCVNPETKRPYTISMIEKGLKEIHFAIKPNRTSKQLALEVIPQLRESMPIERAKMRCRVFVPSKFAKGVKDKITVLFSQIESESFTAGDMEILGLVEPGSYRALDDVIKQDTKGKGQLEILDIRHTADAGDV